VVVHLRRLLGPKYLLVCSVVVGNEKKYAYLHVVYRCVVSSIFVCSIPCRGECVGSDAEQCLASGVGDMNS
jgi:hypothetical protein